MWEYCMGYKYIGQLYVHVSTIRTRVHHYFNPPGLLQWEMKSKSDSIQGKSSQLKYE